MHEERAGGAPVVSHLPTHGTSDGTKGSAVRTLKKAGEKGE